MFSWGTGTFANHPPTGPAAFLLPGLVVNVLSSDETLGRSTNESYTLNVTDDNVSTSFATLTAQTVFGALRGLETFAQMVQYEQNKQYYQMGATLVQDAPRYPYRGIMLDVARHYIPVSAVLATLEAMSYNKLNVMHMHLIDTQSWPLVIESWPRLSGWTAFSNFSHRYTKDDISNIVSFARDRGIRVIPEIDTPSHSDVIKRAYPEVSRSCTRTVCLPHACRASLLCRPPPSPATDAHPHQLQRPRLPHWQHLPQHAGLYAPPDDAVPQRHLHGSGGHVPGRSVPHWWRRVLGRLDPRPHHPSVDDGPQLHQHPGRVPLLRAVRHHHDPQPRQEDGRGVGGHSWVPG